MNKRFAFTFLRFRSVGPHYRGAGRRGAIMNAVRLRIRFVSGRKLVHFSRNPVVARVAYPDDGAHSVDADSPRNTSLIRCRGISGD
jgi:hypothetical protein